MDVWVIYSYDWGGIKEPLLYGVYYNLEDAENEFNKLCENGYHDCEQLRMERTTIKGKLKE